MKVEVAWLPPPWGERVGPGPDHWAAESVPYPGWGPGRTVLEGGDRCGTCLAGRFPPLLWWRTGSNRDQKAKVQEIGTLMKKISFWYK